MFEKYFNNRFLIIYLLPFILGSLTVLSFHPFNFTIINLIIFPLFFYLIFFINKRSKSVYRKKPLQKNLFIFGLFFGFGFYLSGISWITNSLTFDDNFKVLIPFAFVLIPLFLSLFIAFPVLLIGPHLNFNFPSLLIFSGTLAFSDYLRANILSGFPWNLWAYSSVWLNEIIQVVNLIGLYSYNLILITIFTLPVIIFFRISTTKKIVNLILGSFVILSLFIFGNYETNKNLKKLGEVNDKVFVKIISPNFDLKYGLTEEEIEERLEKLIRYSNPSKDKKTLFIWPEGVFSGYSYEDVFIFNEMILKNFSKKHTIIFGINQLDPKSGKFYNSMLAVDNNFKVIQNYNKRKLVPFGEFLPFENFLNNFGLKKITEGHGSFLRGKKNNNIFIDNINFLPLICYEIIFTDLIKKSKIETNLIINISEDGWFGNTIGPDQHFAKSIFRAIESNTFLLRSANKGTSAIIDNKGKIVKRLNRNEAGRIEFDVPLIKSKKVKNDLIFFVLLITYLLIYLIYKKKNAK